MPAWQEDRGRFSLWPRACRPGREMTITDVLNMAALTLGEAIWRNQWVRYIPPIGRLRSCAMDAGAECMQEAR